MAKWQGRKSKKVGPFRVNLSKGGVSVSGGVKGARISANTKGEVHRTTSIPGTGIYKREKIKGGKQRQKETTRTEKVSLSVIDATGGDRRLLDGDPKIEAFEVVGLRQHLGDVAGVAHHAGLTSEKPQAIRDAVLVQRGDDVAVYLMVGVDDNPPLFNRRERKDGTPKATEIGRLGAKSARRFVELAHESDAMAVVYIDAHPMRSHIEVRLRPSEFDDEEDAEVQATEPPPPPPSSETLAADWYPDPWGQHRVRYHDGTQWTGHTAD